MKPEDGHRQWSRSHLPGWVPIPPSVDSREAEGVKIPRLLRSDSPWVRETAAVQFQVLSFSGEGPCRFMCERLGCVAEVSP